MRKADIEVGKEYAIGSDSYYGRRDTKRGTYVGAAETVNVRLGLRDANTVERRGMVCELHESEEPWKYPPGGIKTDAENPRRVLVPSGRLIRLPWELFAKARAEAEERRRTEQEEEQRQRDVLHVVIRKLRDEYGIEPETTEGFSYYASRAEIEMSAEFAAALLAKIDPAQIAADAIDIYCRVRNDELELGTAYHAECKSETMEEIVARLKRPMQDVPASTGAGW